ncbi:MAG: hypothetical protein KGJ60_14800 [Verrucomicrobiota bacterium]|nr:hypothetical protein [Verrucomicrobiota bacterium]
MNAEYEKQLESCVGRELKALGEWEAPPDLARRVMRAIERRAATPWYRREWLAWPMTCRAASLVGLMVAFGLLSLGSARLAHLATLTPLAQHVSRWLSLTDAVWKAAEALATALGLALRSLGPAVILGGAVLMVACYAACLGLGTLCLRLAFAPLNGKSS